MTGLPHIATPRSSVLADFAPPVTGVARLRLTDFRNYANLSLDLAPDRTVVLFGPNGAGKSNLIEAVSYLGAGRGLRGAKLDAADRSPGGGPWAVAGSLRTPDGLLDVGSGRVAGDNGSSRRVARINGASFGPAALARHTAIVWLTPDMDRLFDGNGGRRRRFLDRLAAALSPDHAATVAAYERAMRERGKLLRDSGPAADPSWLSALEEIMAERGVAITVARRETARILDGYCAEIDGPFPAPRIAVNGEVESWIENGPALAAEERLRQALAADRTRDAAAGGAAHGPHRGDWTAFDRRRGVAAEFCSTGEQKALLISLILASARAITANRGAPPLILFDEVAAHLDSRRRNALFEQLPVGGQIWVTGVEASDFAFLAGQGQFLRVEAGRVTPAPVAVPAAARPRGMASETPGGSVTG